VRLPSLSQPGQEIGPGPGDAGPDRADRAVADVGGLLIRQAEHLGENEGEPAFGVEAGEERLDRDGPGGIGLVRGTFDPSREPAPAAEVAHGVGARPARNRQEPGAGAGVAPEGRQGLVGPEVDVLSDVVGEFAADELRAEPPDLPLAAPDPGGEGDLVAVLGGEEELGQFVDADTSK
jgi:hypothetical protein